MCLQTLEIHMYVCGTGGVYQSQKDVYRVTEKKFLYINLIIIYMHACGTEGVSQS